jgi:hypothetical protein
LLAWPAAEGISIAVIPPGPVANFKIKFLENFTPAGLLPYWLGGFAQPGQRRVVGADQEFPP